MPADYPIVRPLKMVDFANQALVESDFVFSRSTAGSFPNASGFLSNAGINEPRPYYEPLTGRYLGLLMEYQSTNVLPWSNDIQASGWYYPPSNGAIASGYVGVNGTATAYRISESAIPNVFYVRNLHTLSSPRYVAPSAFVKSDGVNRGYLQLATYNASGSVVGNTVVYFNLAKQEVYPENYGTNAIASLLEPWKNNWFRLGTVGLVGSGAVLGVLQLVLQDDDGGLFYPGRGRGLLVDGFQVEVASSSANAMISSFIATSGAAATRATDSLVSDGARLNNWNTAGAKTIYQEAIVDNRDFLGVGRCHFQIGNTVNNSYADLRFVANSAGGLVQGTVISGNTVVAFANTAFGTGLNAWESASSGTGSAKPVFAHCALTFSASGAFFAYNGIVSSGLAATVVPSGVNKVEITPIAGGKLILRRCTIYPELPSGQALLLTRP